MAKSTPATARCYDHRNHMAHADGDDDYDGYDVMSIDDDGDAN